LAERPELTFARKLAYGVGQMAEGLKNGAFGVFLFFYYVQVLGLSGTYAGLAVGIALMFDALTDPHGRVAVGQLAVATRQPSPVHVRLHRCRWRSRFVLLFSPPALRRVRAVPVAACRSPC
jgi:lantibiotic modifying enzyme